MSEERRALIRLKTQDSRLKTQEMETRRRGDAGTRRQSPQSPRTRGRVAPSPCRLPVLCLPLLMVLAGCVGWQEQPRSTSPVAESDLVRGTEGPLPQRFQLHDVPHNPRRQRGTDCAPDSLRMVLNYRGKNVARDWDIPRLLTRELTGLRGRAGGTSFYQMQRIAVEYYGLPAFIIQNCDLYSLKAAILNKWPPIVSYRASGKSYHAVVAVGYDDKRRTMFVHDPNFIRVKKMRYYDLGGVSKGSIQRLSSLLVLPQGSTEEDMMRGLERYVPKELSSKLRISSMLPSQELGG